MQLRQFVVVVVIASSIALAAPPPAAAAPAVPTWRPPVDGSVVRGFDAPANRYGAGHRGVDYRAARGTEVRAAGSGVVAFAGVVGGAIHVVVAHANGLRTSYSFLLDTTVHRGQRVATGAVVGHAGGTGDDHDGAVVHFGLRVGDRYVDPLVLFRPPDLTKVVHLAPHRDPVLDSIGGERRGLIAGFGHALGAVAHAVTGAAGTVVHLGAAALRHIDTLARGGIADLRELVEFLDSLSPSFTGLDTLRIARRLISWARSQLSCDRHAPPADGTGGSGNRVMVVAGINSHRARHGSSLPKFPVEKLGYDRDDVDYYSYAGDGGAYGEDATHQPLETAARNLRGQLRAEQRAHPGEPVDLIAHSQGGVVALTYLLLYYDPDDKTLPPLGNVITVSSPLRGAPLASIVNVLATTSPGRALLRKYDFDGLSARQLTEHSEIIERIARAKLPDEVELTTIGAATDTTVPASSAHLDGAHNIDVAPMAAKAHDAVLSDAHALRAMRAALEHHAMPCTTIVEGVSAAVLPVAISRVEHLGPVGAIGAATSP